MKHNSLEINKVESPRKIEEENKITIRKKNKVDREYPVELDNDLDELDELNSNVRDVRIERFIDFSRVETIDEITAINNGKDDVFFSEFKKGMNSHVDIQFPPNFKSVVGKCTAFNTLESEIKFFKVEKIYKSPLIFKLEEDDGDLKQFQLYPNYFGNFMFCLAVMMLHQRRSILLKILNNQKVNNSGIYTFNLYINHKWQTVEVDDFLPVFKKIMLFSTSNTNELWPIFLEKAYSKSIGSYFEASRIFDLENILLTLTGFPSEKIYLEKEEGEEKILKHFKYIEENLKEGNILVIKTKSILDGKELSELKPNH